ncbi:MAG: CHRD domain-containing protein [Bacteroidetes bacterium]|nr:MAG: CHRD domain-containing protein [Bacteroidota bacterium]
MKTFNLRSIMWAIPFLIGSVALTSCDNDDDDLNDNRTYVISGNASGSQVVPAVSGSGQGTVTGTYNSKTNTMNYTSTWTNLSGAPTSAGFYAGNAGASGTLVGNTWTLGSGLTATGTTTGTIVLTDAQETQLLNNGWYYSYGTATNTGGEVRGQITTTIQ